MSRRTFTVAEVDHLIPTLEGIFITALQLRSGMRAAEEKLARANVEVDLESEIPSDAPPALRHALAVYRGLYATLTETLEQVRSLGGSVKDLDTGLVDFPGRRETEDILLCWRFGEKRLGFWHAVDSGFAGRRPLDEHESGLPPRVD